MSSIVSEDRSTLVDEQDYESVQDIPIVKKQETTMEKPNFLMDLGNRLLEFQFLKERGVYEWISFLVILSYIAGSYNYSIIYVLILIYCGHFAYSRAFNRMRVSLVGVLEEDSRRDKLELHTESANWFNYILQRFWTVYEPDLSSMIVESVDWVLDANRPSFLDSIRLTEFTLGSDPPKILSAKVYPETESDIVHLDLELVFIPNDEENLMQRKMNGKFQWNSKVVLTARFGKGLVGVDIPIMIKELQIKANIRIQLKLISTSPYVKLLEISFLSLPELDFILKPLKSFDLMDLPGLSSWLESLVLDPIASFMVNPNKLTLDIDQMVNGSYVTFDKAIGVAKISIHQAKDLPKMDALGSCDAYVRIDRNEKPLAKTKTINDSLNPYWNEILYILVYSKDDILDLKLFDYNQIKKHKMFGVVKIGATENLKNAWFPIKKEFNFKKNSELNFDCTYYPVSEKESADAIVSGIVRITVHQAKDLLRSSIGKIYNPYVEIYTIKGQAPHPDTYPNEYGNVLNMKTKFKKRNNSPSFEETFEIFVSNIEKTSLQLVIRDHKEILTGGNNVIGDVILHLQHIAKKEITKKDWYSVRYADSGRLRLDTDFVPINIGNSHVISEFTSSIGVLEITINEAKINQRNLINDIMGAVGKKQFYVRAILSNGYSIKSSKAVAENLTANWNESFYLNLISPEELLTFEVYEFSNLKKDSMLGKHQMSVIDIVQSKNKEAKIAPLTLLSDHNTGELDFSVCYYQAEPYMTHENESSINALTSPASEMSFHSIKDDISQTESAKNGIENTDLNVSSKILNDIPAFSCILLQVKVKEARSLKNKMNTFADIFVNDEQEDCSRTSVKRKTDNPVWNETFEFFIKAINNSKLNFVIKESKDIITATSNTIVGSLSIPIQSILKMNFQQDTWLTLKNAEQGEICVAFEIKILPGLNIAAEEPGEQTILEVEIIKAEDLIAADNTGLSDPFCVLKLNGEKVFKTKVVKKCINPVWNESFELPIENRATSNLTIEVRDWNKVNFSSPLGSITFQLKDLPLSTPIEQTVDLQSVSSGKISVKFYLYHSTADRQETSNLLHNISGKTLKTIRNARKNIRKRFQSIAQDEAQEIMNDFDSDQGSYVNSSTNSTPMAKLRSDVLPTSDSFIQEEQGDDDTFTSYDVNIQEVKLPSNSNQNFIPFKPLVNPLDLVVKIQYQEKTIFKTKQYKKATGLVYLNETGEMFLRKGSTGYLNIDIKNKYRIKGSETVLQIQIPIPDLDKISDAKWLLADQSEPTTSLDPNYQNGAIKLSITISKEQIQPTPGDKDNVVKMIFNKITKK